MTRTDRCRLRSPSTKLSGQFSEQKRDIFMSCTEGLSLIPRNAETTLLPYAATYGHGEVDDWT